MADNTIRPKLVVADAAAAIEFYRAALGAEVLAAYPIGDSIVFAELEILGCSVTLKDADRYDPVMDPGPLLDVVVDDPDGVAAAMLEHGATFVFPVTDQPYGARGGRVRDPYGVQWLLATPSTMAAEDWPAVAEQLRRADEG